MVRDKTDHRGSRRARSFTHSAVQTYSTSLAVGVVSLANVMIMARSLGATGRGQVAFLTAIAWLMANLAMLGVPESNSNFAAAEPGTRRALATNSVVLSLVLGILAIAALAGLIRVFPGVAGDADKGLLSITLLFVPLIILESCLRSIAQADYAFTVLNVIHLLPAVVNVVVNSTLVALGVLSVSAAVGVWLIGQSIATAIIAWYVARRLAGFGAPDIALAWRTLAFGVKAHVGRIMQLGNYRLDQWLLGAVAGSRELGLYSVAVAWAETLWYLPTALASVQRPYLVRAVRDAAARQAARVLRGALVITAIGGAIMIVAAPALCTVAFGSEFGGAVDDLRVLVAGAFGMVTLKLLGNVLVAQGLPLLQSLAVGAGFALTVALDIALIPPFGGLGAALASSIAYTAAGVVVTVLMIRKLGGTVADLVPRVDDVVFLASRGHEMFRSRRSGVEGRPGPHP